VLSPVWRRFYIERFWVHARGTVIRSEGEIVPEAEDTWTWTPTIEYDAAGQRFRSRVSYWQRLNAKSKYSVGDQMEILYDSRKPLRFILDSWIEYIIFTIIICAFVVSRLLEAR
jgi:hypothetical protein